MDGMTTAVNESRVPGRTLGLFAKYPEPGQVKTRLAVDTSPAWAATVAAAFLADLVERLSGVRARRVLAFTPPAAEPYFGRLVQGRFLLTPQHGEDLGRRLAAFFAEQFRQGAGPVVLVGTDSPTLPNAFVEQAFAEMERADVVLGPATDGGYYLIGCGRSLPALFEEIPWSMSTVLTEAIARLPEATRLALLPPWYDVDTLENWRMLRGHVMALRRAGKDPEVPCVERLMAKGPW
jgi:rSAM/selenodomain-associated transferase 1